MTDLNTLEDIKAALAATPGWDALNAYERTLRCCEEFSRRGEDLPSWYGIRELVGKGSANDINRAKANFKRGQAELYRKHHGTPPGIPETVAPIMQKLWLTALEQAEAAFAQQAQTWQEQLGESSANISLLHRDHGLAQQQIQQLNGQLASLDDRYREQQALLEGERLARQQAERLWETNQTALIQQREGFKQALENAQAEMKAAIGRLEGAETHAMMEIERVKADEKLKLAVAEANIQKLKDERTVAEARQEKRVEELKAQLVQLAQDLAVLAKENEALASRLARAEAQADRFQQDNARMVGGVKSLTVKTMKKRHIDSRK